MGMSSYSYLLDNYRQAWLQFKQFTYDTPDYAIADRWLTIMMEFDQMLDEMEDL